MPEVVIKKQPWWKG